MSLRPLWLYRVKASVAWALTLAGAVELSVASDSVPEGRWRAEEGKACITQEPWLQSQDHLSPRLVSVEWSVG